MRPAAASGSRSSTVAAESTGSGNSSSCISNLDGWSDGKHELPTAKVPLQHDPLSFSTPLQIASSRHSNGHRQGSRALCARGMEPDYEASLGDAPTASERIVITEPHSGHFPNVCLSSLHALERHSLPVRVKRLESQHGDADRLDTIGGVGRKCGPSSERAEIVEAYLHPLVRIIRAEQVKREHSHEFYAHLSRKAHNFNDA